MIEALSHRPDRENNMSQRLWLGGTISRSTRDMRGNYLWSLSFFPTLIIPLSSPVIL